MLSYAEGAGRQTEEWAEDHNECLSLNSRSRADGCELMQAHYFAALNVPASDCARAVQKDWKRLSVPDLTLTGHTENAEFALSTSSAAPYVASGGQDTNVSNLHPACSFPLAAVLDGCLVLC